MISIIAKFSVNEGKVEQFLELITPLIEASNKEEGCIEYILHQEIENTNEYCLIEKWKDQAAVDFHNNTPHFKATVPKLMEIAKVDVKVYRQV
jgi:quinol monooxygenase YgiN